MTENNKFIKKSLEKSVGVLSSEGALMVSTGQHTGRSTKERYVVRSSSVESTIDWGKVNQPVSPEFAAEYFAALKKVTVREDNPKMQGFVGCFPISVFSTSSWHIAFAQNMFRESAIESVQDLVPGNVQIEIFHYPEGTVSELGLSEAFPHDTAIILDPEQLRVGIVGTAYAGEIKKSAFTLCNYLMPEFGIMPMHSSANCLPDGSNSSVLFGLSGTGKTTLSADPRRSLIGDDEIVWTKNGLSNLEGGCYAKLINLDKDKEPDIYEAANRPGSIMENVFFDPVTKVVDFTDDRYTENTRASYSISALDKVFDQNIEAQAPTSIVFLTADAFGALPAVAKLNSMQAQYHFISGYTAKVAGTEIGVTEPTATFSACFGAPFMPRSASVYGKLLADLIEKYNVSVWLVNTGWMEGGASQSERYPIPVSRAILSAIQSGELSDVPTEKHPVFGFDVPTTVPGVAKEFLSVPSGPAVMTLAKEFMKNAEALGDKMSEEVRDQGGPHIYN
ncbi:MAG: phosphoenolpyruvate carboxykinase (ATP) [Bdellovibrionales bacterium]|nr:phosphoenolpyruvate carboxykinase (ATP) [Bdellovibrionales bacterium]